MKPKTIAFISILALFVLFIYLAEKEDLIPNAISNKEISKFESEEQFLSALEKASADRQKYYEKIGEGYQIATQELGDSSGDQARDFSETNIQVEGVDEADIIKTDGDYIYTIAQGKLIIAKAYPANEAEILSEIEFDNFYPSELFIEKDRLLLFGSAYYEDKSAGNLPEFSYFPVLRGGYTSVKLYDLSDKNNPDLIKKVDIEGDYLTSRKIGSDVYFIANSYINIYGGEVTCEEIVPLYREESGDGSSEFGPIAKCAEIGYTKPIQPDNFYTIASISMEDENKEINKEVIVGSGQNVYMSLDNLYIAETNYPYYVMFEGPIQQNEEKTKISKFSLNDGEIDYIGTNEVKGHILNQFSMDEYDNHFRIATTSGNLWSRDEETKSKNNIYVLDENLDLVGALEDLAPGEKIYSTRFIGKRGYMVTFKKVDPLFVIDLSDHNNPKVLGKLKIPGYSDYLHPYDENHIIGIGKDTIDPEDDLKEDRGLDFAWYQGVKIAIFDVSDVENPIEKHKIIIGDRGTESEALYNHKAFLFDKEKELLVIPILLAEIDDESKQKDWTGWGVPYGDYTFQGAYVYNINLDDGFNLKGRISHYGSNDSQENDDSIFSGDYSIRRSLYIDDNLYTLSDKKLMINDLSSLEELKALEF